ncbi:hypothetical protein CHELA40_11970 [Chelatococcus asaccharovorans]|nr:hypothetical protein CHELA40_11970 [Chelatococcus asaccharovorans]
MHRAPDRPADFHLRAVDHRRGLAQLPRGRHTAAIPELGQYPQRGRDRHAGGLVADGLPGPVHPRGGDGPQPHGRRSARRSRPPQHLAQVGPDHGHSHFHPGESGRGKSVTALSIMRHFEPDSGDLCGNPVATGICRKAAPARSDPGPAHWARCHLLSANPTGASR